MGAEIRLTVVMPVYNEQGCIASVCGEWLSLLEVYPGGRLVVIDDGSTDRTGGLLDGLAVAEPRLCVVHQPNAGHGAALRTAYQRALSTGCDWVFQVDSDGQFSPGDFAKLWARRGESDFVTGLRQERHDPWQRLVITRLLRLVILLVFGVRLEDSNIPFRLMRAQFLERLLAELPPGVFAPNIFLAVLAAKAGCPLLEIPVAHLSRGTGEVSIRGWKLLGHCLRSLRELADFRSRLPGALERLRAGRHA
ncbi:MAG: glycosyltransferase family 2 protein [Elusimicrobia bacterium]|nr:glycosyltransferase family 2 protein [Elusimicrobiota bacterium]